MSTVARRLLLPRVTRPCGAAFHSAARCSSQRHVVRSCGHVRARPRACRFASSTASASPPLTVYSLQLPQLSPSMTAASITRFHVQAGGSVKAAELVFTLHTTSLLDSTGGAGTSSHAMLVESHDPGVVAWLDEQLAGSGREVPVGQLLGWLWQDEQSAQSERGRQAEIHRAVQEAARASTAAEGGVPTEQVVNGIRVQPFMWQAYMAESERQDEEEDAPMRKK